jgi:thiol-disulfide isomerase/thioredoxin
VEKAEGTNAMKKNLFVAGIVIVLLAAAILADRAGLLGKAGSASASAAITDLQGKPLDLAPYKGQVVLVNFWATWCAPCLIEIPWMIEFQDKYAARGFTVLGVSMDEDGLTSVEPYVRDQEFEVDGRQRKLNYPILVNSTGVEEQFGGLLGLPTTVILGRDGQPAKRFIGLTSHEKLVKEIETLLGQPTR